MSDGTAAAAEFPPGEPEPDEVASDDASLSRDGDDPSKWPVFVDADVDTDPLFANGPAVTDGDQGRG